MDQISKINQCKWCLSKLAEPVVLPCGDTVCQKHTEDLKKEDWKCLLCDGIHKLADGEHFPINKYARSVIEMNLDKINFGVAYNDAKKEVTYLDSKLEDLKHAIKEPKDYVVTLMSKYTNQVDLEREELKAIIDNVCEEIENDITEFQPMADQNIEKEAANMVKLADELEPLVKDWQEKLNNLEVRPSLYKKITSEAKTFRKRVDHQLEGALEPPLTLTNIPKSVQKRVWLEVSQKLDNKSIWLRDVSKIAKATSWNSIDSETFQVQGFSFCLRLEFEFYEGILYLGTYLNPESDLKERSINLSYKFNAYGKNDQIIETSSLNYEFNDESGYGYSNFMSLKDIIAHPAFDAQEDMIRIEVVVDETSAKVTDL